jgi:hypothetical protein
VAEKSRLSVAVRGWELTKSGLSGQEPLAVTLTKSLLSAVAGVLAAQIWKRFPATQVGLLAEQEGGYLPAT